MPRAAADHPLRRTWLWLALLLSAVLHVAVAAALWRTQQPDSTETDARPLMFELVRTGASEAATGEPPQHDGLPPSPETASAPPANTVAEDDALPVPPTPTPTSTPADPVAPASKTTQPASKTAQHHTRPIKPRPTSSRTSSPQTSERRSSPANKSEERPSRPPQTKRSTATGATTAPASAGKASTPASSGRTPTTQPGESTAGQRAAERAYLTALQRAIARRQRYPAGARRHGQTGVATLAFVIDATGRLSQIRLAQSSGHAALDQAALQALAQLGRFDPIPKSLSRSTWSLRIPIRFDLK